MGDGCLEDTDAQDERVDRKSKYCANDEFSATRPINGKGMAKFNHQRQENDASKRCTKARDQFGRNAASCDRGCERRGPPDRHSGKGTQERANEGLRMTGS